MVVAVPARVSRAEAAALPRLVHPAAPRHATAHLAPRRRIVPRGAHPLSALGLRIPPRLAAVHPELEPQRVREQPRAIKTLFAVLAQDVAGSGL